ncbi:MAG: phospholipase C accessory protein PlcR [Collimonas pratensis]|uniref:phospholipase C accessory protein PlcR n=1 Tax=Collimonas pratensis TaxID=279113 RepID=UPI003C74FC66
MRAQASCSRAVRLIVMLAMTMAALPAMAAASAAEQDSGDGTSGPVERGLDLPALRQSLRGQSDAEAKLADILAFARFRDHVQMLVAMSAGDRARQALQLLEELPQHVYRGELPPIQAIPLSSALLAYAVPDPLARSVKEQQSEQHWKQYAQKTVGPSPALDPRHKTYERESLRIYQEVMSTVSDPQQQQAVLMSRLQALRVQLYDKAKGD